MFKIGTFYTENDDDDKRKQNDMLKTAFCKKKNSSVVLYGRFPLLPEVKNKQKNTIQCQY